MAFCSRECLQMWHSFGTWSKFNVDKATTSKRKDSECQASLNHISALSSLGKPVSMQTHLLIKNCKMLPKLTLRKLLLYLLLSLWFTLSKAFYPIFFLYRCYSQCCWNKSNEILILSQSGPSGILLYLISFVLCHFFPQDMLCSLCLLAFACVDFLT